MSEERKKMLNLHGYRLSIIELHFTLKPLAEALFHAVKSLEAGREKHIEAWFEVFAWQKTPHHEILSFLKFLKRLP